MLLEAAAVVAAVAGTRTDWPVVLQFGPAVAVAAVAGNVRIRPANAAARICDPMTTAAAPADKPSESSTPAQDQIRKPSAPCTSGAVSTKIRLQVAQLCGSGTSS